MVGLSLSGCNTVHGFGRDISRLSEIVQGVDFSSSDDSGYEVQDVQMQ